MPTYRASTTRLRASIYIKTSSISCRAVINQSINQAHCTAYRAPRLTPKDPSAVATTEASYYEYSSLCLSIGSALATGPLLNFAATQFFVPTQSVAPTPSLLPAQRRNESAERLFKYSSTQFLYSPTETHAANSQRVVSEQLLSVIW